jgi:fructose-specific component phosphotransferase system IIB-like protein
MSVQIDWNFVGDDAKKEIGAAARYLLRNATGSARDDIVREIVEIVNDAAIGLVPPDGGSATSQRVTYKDYVIDTYRRDTDRWRATIRRANGKKIRVTFPLSVCNETTTPVDAITAAKAVEHAKAAIDNGDLV